MHAPTAESAGVALDFRRTAATNPRASTAIVSRITSTGCSGAGAHSSTMPRRCWSKSNWSRATSNDSTIRWPQVGGGCGISCGSTGPHWRDGVGNTGATDNVAKELLGGGAGGSPGRPFATTREGPPDCVGLHAATASQPIPQSVRPKYPSARRSGPRVGFSLLRRGGSVATQIGQSAAGAVPAFRLAPQPPNRALERTRSRGGSSQSLVGKPPWPAAPMCLQAASPRPW